MKLVFFKHLLCKICSMAAIVKSYHTNFPTSYSWHTLHKYLWVKSLTNTTAKKCDCKCCHCNSKNTHRTCFCNNLIALFGWDTICSSWIFFEHVPLMAKKSADSHHILHMQHIALRDRTQRSLLQFHFKKHVLIWILFHLKKLKLH